MEQQLQQINQAISAITANSPKEEAVPYIPSSKEKKRAVILYFLFGIMMVIADKKTNEFEYFHLKQAMWRWITFMVFLVLSLIVLFLPVIKFLGILLMLILVWIMVVFIKQARDGKYYPTGKYGLIIFSSLGNWLLSLFDVQFDEISWPSSSQWISPPLQ